MEGRGVGVGETEGTGMVGLGVGEIVAVAVAVADGAPLGAADGAGWWPPDREALGLG